MKFPYLGLYASENDSLIGSNYIIRSEIRRLSTPFKESRVWFIEDLPDRPVKALIDMIDRDRCLFASRALGWWKVHKHIARAVRQVTCMPQIHPGASQLVTADHRLGVTLERAIDMHAHPKCVMLMATWDRVLKLTNAAIRSAELQRMVP